METMELALKTLDIQYGKIWETRIGESRNSQFAYYNGLKQMFELMTGDQLEIDISGKHSVCVQDGRRTHECEHRADNAVVGQSAV